MTRLLGGVAALVAALLLAPAAPVSAGDERVHLAVIPDTQAESYRVAAKRARWISARRFDAVAHVGDVTNWGARDVSQFTRARKWIGLLPEVPRAVAIGNHDTAAVGVGGSAYDPPRTGALLRDTRAFNRADLIPAPAGAWQRGRADNVWVPINRRWAMLTLELWPRAEAVAWANRVVRSQPRRLWIVVTHACLTSGGRISGSSGYGATSPLYLRDRLVRPNRNVRAVLCGHNGRTATLRDRQATWVLTNRTTPGLVRTLTLTPTSITTRLRLTQ